MTQNEKRQKVFDFLEKNNFKQGYYHNGVFGSTYPSVEVYVTALGDGINVKICTYNKTVSHSFTKKEIAA